MFQQVFKKCRVSGYDIWVGHFQFSAIVSMFIAQSCCKRTELRGEMCWWDLVNLLKPCSQAPHLPLALAGMVDPHPGGASRQRDRPALRDGRDACCDGERGPRWEGWPARKGGGF